MTRTLLLLLAALLLAPLTGQGGPLERNPVTGKGVVVIPAWADETVKLYDLPGIRPLETTSLKELPALTALVTAGSEDPPLAVLAALAIREGWLRIIRDPAGREAWVFLKDEWRYQPWERFLAGRSVRLANGLKDLQYRILQTPSPQGGQAGTAKPGVPLPVLSVSGDWIETLTADGTTGWLRWRDGDERMLVIVE